MIAHGAQHYCTMSSPSNIQWTVGRTQLGTCRCRHGVCQITWMCDMCQDDTGGVVTPCAKHIWIPPSPHVSHIPTTLLPCLSPTPRYSCILTFVPMCCHHPPSCITLHIMVPLLPHWHSTLPYPPLTPLVSSWHMSCIHVIWHMPRFEMRTVSAPACAPPEFSLLFVKYCGMKFIVQ